MFPQNAEITEFKHSINMIEEYCQRNHISPPQVKLIFEMGLGAHGAMLERQRIEAEEAQ